MFGRQHTTFGKVIVLVVWIWMLVQQTASGPLCHYNAITVRNGSSTWCLDCDKCPLGKGLSHECASYVDSGVEISCVPCVEGKTFSDKDDISSCQPCTICDENEVTLRNCTVKQNARCGKCKHGFYRDQSRGCSRCSPCCANSTTDDVVRECREQGMPADNSCRVRAQECTVLEIPSARPPLDDTTHVPGIIGRGTRKGRDIKIIAPTKATNVWLYCSVPAALVFCVIMLLGLRRYASNKFPFGNRICYCDRNDYNQCKKAEAKAEPCWGTEERGSVHSVAWPITPLKRQFVSTTGQSGEFV